MSRQSVLSLFCMGLARKLGKQPDNPYIKDLAIVLNETSPALLQMLDSVDGRLEFYWYEGALFMETDEGEYKQLLP